MTIRTVVYTKKRKIKGKEVELKRLEEQHQDRTLTEKLEVSLFRLTYIYKS